MPATNKVVNKAYLLTQFTNYNSNVINQKVAAINSNIATKVDKVAGYGLSKNDFTDALKTKLEGLNNYSDSQIRSLIQANTAAITTLNGDVNTQGSILNTVESRVQDVIDSAPADFDTLKEISDWIDTHSGAAATMNQNIQANASAISALQSAQDNMEYEFEDTNIDFSTIDYEPITVSGASEVTMGSTITLTSDVNGVTWSSSDDNVATVDSNGVVTPVAPGLVVITASKSQYISGTHDVTVNAASQGE